MRCTCKIFLKHPVFLADARETVITDDRFGGAGPLIDEIRTRVSGKIKPLIEKGHPVVTQGFIGSTLQGETTSLGREGSDFSATLLAEGMGAKTVQIWSDVPGIASADPKWVPDAFIIPELSYSSASLMAQKGAKILFPSTLEPACRQGISVFVGSAPRAKCRRNMDSSEWTTSRRPSCVGSQLDQQGKSTLFDRKKH